MTHALPSSCRAQYRVVFAPVDSLLLQQAAHLTGGLYHRPTGEDMSGESVRQTQARARPRRARPTARTAPHCAPEPCGRPVAVPADLLPAGPAHAPRSAASRAGAARPWSLAELHAAAPQPRSPAASQLRSPAAPQPWLADLSRRTRAHSESSCSAQPAALNGRREVTVQGGLSPLPPPRRAASRPRRCALWRSGQSSWAMRAPSVLLYSATTSFRCPSAPSVRRASPAAG